MPHKNYKQTPEHKAKISASLKTLCNSPNHRKKMSKAYKKAWQGMPQEQKDRHISAQIKGWTPEKKARQSIYHKERCKSLEVRRKMRAVRLGRGHTPETRARMCIIQKKLHKSPEFIAKLSAGLKKSWQEKSQERKDRCVKAVRLANYACPNKTETYLANLLNSTFPKEWKYVGNGKVIIDGKNPDFININGKKKIIELFGDYWHGKLRTGMSNTKVVNARTRAFAKYGFDTLVIWESELKNRDSILAKVAKFTNSRKTSR